MGIPLSRGREFGEHDTTPSGKVAIVNEAFAKKFFPGSDPPGKHVIYSTDRIDCEIVGVVAKRSRQPAADGCGGWTVPAALAAPLAGCEVAGAGRNPEGMPAAIRERVQLADQEQAIAQSMLLDEVIAERLGGGGAPRRW